MPACVVASDSCRDKPRDLEPHWGGREMYLRKRVFLSGDEKEKEGSVLESYTGSHLQRLSCVSGCCLLSRIGGFFLPLSLSSPTSHGEIRRHQSPPRGRLGTNNGRDRTVVLEKESWGKGNMGNGVCDHDLRFMSSSPSEPLSPHVRM